MDKVTIEEMKQEHLDGAARVLTNGFLELNEIWRALDPSYEQVFPIIRGNIIPSYKSGLSFVMLKGKKIIAVSIQYDLLQYLKMPHMPSHLQLFKILAQTGKNLDKKVDYSQFKIGDVSYGLYGFIDPAQAGNRHAMRFWWYQFAIGKVGGWKYYYSTISSPISLKLLQRFGAQILAETEVVQTQSRHKMWMVRIDLRRPMPSFTQMTQMLFSEKPKL